MPVVQAFVVPHPPMIVPAVGGGREGEIAKTIQSYRTVAARIRALAPDTVVILSPHSTVYSDYLHISPGDGAKGSLGQFGAPEVTEVRYDPELVRTLEALCGAENLPAGTLGEQSPDLDHGTLVPLHFILAEYREFRVVRIAPAGLSREDHYRFGMILARAVESLGRRAVVVASGDLSHKLTADGPYGFAPEGPELDRRLTEVFASGDFGALFGLEEELCEKGAECGFRPVLMMAGALDKKAVEAELLSYEGPFGVGYAVASFAVTGNDPDRSFLEKQQRQTAERIAEVSGVEDAFVRLARTTLEGYVCSGSPPPIPENWPPELTRARAGVFVSLKKQGQLRGCIGTTAPTTASVAAEIRRNAVAAGTEDPRFDPVQAHELDELVYSVDVLAPAEPCDEGMLDPSRYGVIVTSGHKRGLLLPNLEGVDTVKEQIAIARQKAGIRAGEPCTLERFEVVRHK